MIEKDFQEIPITIKLIDNLKVKIYSNRTAMGKAAGKDVAKKLRDLLSQQEKVRIIFASAPSQTEFLCQLSKEEGIDWTRVIAFHMDEYIGLPQESPQLFSRYIDNHLFSIVNPGEVHFISSTNITQDECKRYADLIKQDPIDIVCMGIGENGHIAFNDPPVADFQDPEVIKLVELDEKCRKQQVNDGCFPKINQVPTHALTLTIPTLMAGKYIFCVVPGKTKFHAVQSTLNSPISKECPATILRKHPQSILYLDMDSFGEDE